MSRALGDTTGRELEVPVLLWAGDDHPVGELLVTWVVALLFAEVVATVLLGSLGPAGLPTWTWEVAGGLSSVWTKPLAVLLPPACSQAAVLALSGVTSPFASRTFCGTPIGLVSAMPSPGCLEARFDNLGLTEVASGLW